MSWKMSQGLKDQIDIVNVTNSHCVKCGVDMACGADSDTPSCWCKGFPRLPPEVGVDGSQCLCPNCLGLVLNRSVERGIEEKGVSAMVVLASENGINSVSDTVRGKPGLVEHVDFQIENGKYVFSSWYHLKRGYCCGSGCRNCPFD